MDYDMHLSPTGRRRDVDDELCAMFDESSQRTIVLPEECLGYAAVVPVFPPYGLLRRLGYGFA